MSNSQFQPSTDITVELEKISLRLSLSNSEKKYESFVNKSLPLLIKYLATYENHRKKIFEILSDIMRNVKNYESMDLPVIDLFSLYNDDTRNTFMQNFSYIYLKLGYPRKSLTFQAELLSTLLNSLTEDKPIVQRDALLHLTFPVLRYISHISFNKHEMRLADSHYQRRFIAEFYTLVLLLPYDFLRSIQFSNVDVCLVDGMSVYDFNRLVNEKYSNIFPNGQLESYKEAIVSFFTRGIFTPEETIIPILFANADTRHSVVSLASKELRLLSYEVDWEDSNLLSNLMDWYLGRSREFDPMGHILKMRNPLSSRMRVKLTPYLLRSRITLPGPLISDLISAILLGLTSALITSRNVVKQGSLTQEKKLDNQGSITSNSVNDSLGSQQNQQAESIDNDNLSNSVVSTNSAESVKVGIVSLMQHRKLADHSLDLLQHLITYSRLTCSTNISAALHCLINFVCEKSPEEFNYVRIRGLDLLAKMFNRQPFFLLSEPLQLPRLFDLLCQDISLDLKKAVGKCLIRLSSSLEKLKIHYFNTFRNQFAKIEEILFENIEKSEVICRLVALCYAETIYDSDHIPTRYLILQALGDKDPTVQYQARQIFSPFFSPDIAYDIVFGKIKLPSFVEFVNHDTNHPRQNPFVDVERLVPVVRFIRFCLLAEQGGLSSSQESEMTYESEDEFRYRINQNVRHFLVLQQKNQEINEKTATKQKALTDAAPNFDIDADNNKVELNEETIAHLESVGLSQNIVDELLDDAAGMYARINQEPDSQKEDEKNNDFRPGSSSPSSNISPEKARRCIDTYFRLIQVVIFTRTRNNKESNDFPKFLEEVLVNNTKDLLINGKQLFERINTVLLISSRGASCRHACASVYSVVTMETQPPHIALQTALAMLPENVTVLDNDMSHCLQGMCMGTAYLLESLHTTYYNSASLEQQTSSSSPIEVKETPVLTTTNSNKKKNNNVKSKKCETEQDSETDPVVISKKILIGIQKLLNIIDQFLVPSTNLGSQKITTSSHNVVIENRYSNISVARNTITALLEALKVLGESGALSDLLVSRPPTSQVKDRSRPPLTASKQAFLHRLSCYIPPNLNIGIHSKDGAAADENFDDIKKLVDAAIRAMVSIAIGEKDRSTKIHLSVLKSLVNTVKVKEASLHLSVGTAMIDVLLGEHTPFKGHWYQRTYPLKVGPQELIKPFIDPDLNSDSKWLQSKLVEFLTPLQGQVTTRQETISAAIWCLAIVKRISAPIHGLIPIDSIIGLFHEKEIYIQCIGVACFGLIFDTSSDEDKQILLDKIAKYIEANKGSPNNIYVDLYELSVQINRPDLALSLFVLAISSCFTVTESEDPMNKSLSSLLAEIGSSLLRRLGRNLASALPHLVPRIYVSRFDYSRPNFQKAMESIWKGLVVYADDSSTSTNFRLSSPHSSSEKFYADLEFNNSTRLKTDQHSSMTSLDEPFKMNEEPGKSSYFYGEMDTNRFFSQLTILIEAHFNAIVCEIKSLLGFIPSAQSNTSDQNTTSTTSVVISENACNEKLKDACCYALVSLCKHPSAERKLAGHLPTLLAGLFSIIEASKSSPAPGYEYSFKEASKDEISPAEKACIAVQKMVLQVFENPSSREAAIFLFPGLLPVLIETTISLPFGLNNPVKLNADGLAKVPAYLTEESESKKLSLDIILAAVRVSNASALMSILPILILAGLHTMAYLPPNRICSLIRQPIAAANAMNIPPTSYNNRYSSVTAPTSSTTNIITVPSVEPNQIRNRAKVKAEIPTNCIPTSFSREIQMAEILSICLRLIDDSCLSDLVITFTELIRLGGILPEKSTNNSSSTPTTTPTIQTSVSVSVAVCVLITQLATRCSWVRRHHSTILPSPTTQALLQRRNIIQPLNELAIDQDFIQPAPDNQTKFSSAGPLSSQTSSSQSSPQWKTKINNVVGGHSTSSSSRKNVDHENGTTNKRPSNNNNNKTNLNSQKFPEGTETLGASLNLAPYAGKLLAALLAAIPGASRHTDIVRIEMNRAVVSLLPFAKESTVVKLINRVTGWYMENVAGNESSEEIRYCYELAASSTLMTIVNHSHQIVQKNASLIFPIIFIARQKEEEIVNNFERASYIMMFSLAGRIMAMTISLCFANSKWKPTEPWCVGLSKNSNKTDFITMRNKWSDLWSDAQAVYITHCHTISKSSDSPTLVPSGEESTREDDSATSPKSMESSSIKEGDNNASSPDKLESGPLPQRKTILKDMDKFVSLRSQSFVVKPNIFPQIISSIEQILYGSNQSMRWPIRTQAALALWSLSVNLIEANNNVAYNWAEEPNEELLLSVVDLAVTMASEERPLLVSKQDRRSIYQHLQNHRFMSSEDGTNDQDTKTLNIPESTSNMNSEDIRFNHKVWLKLTNVIIQSLKETNPWTGKIYIIRSAALLCFYACDRDLSNNTDENANEADILEKLFYACLSESRKKRAINTVSCMGALEVTDDEEASGYRVEALFACSCVLEASDQSLHLILDKKDDVSSEVSDQLILSSKLISKICQIILPNYCISENILFSGIKTVENVAKNKGKKQRILNKYLNDYELQVAMLTLTLLWPESRKNQDLKILPDLLEFIVTVLPEVSTNVQIATLNMLIEILNKVSPSDIQFGTNDTPNMDAVKIDKSVVSLLEILEKFSFQSSNFGLQEQSLKVLSAIVFHPSLINSHKETIEKLIDHFMKQNKSAASCLQELASQLHGKLQIS